MTLESWLLLVVFNTGLRFALGWSLTALFCYLTVSLVPLIIYQGTITEVDGLDVYAFWVSVSFDLNWLWTEIRKWTK